MKAQANNIEHRFCGEGLEVRKMDGKKPKVRGYALLYNSVYDMGWFTEEVERGALDKADMSDVRILFNHDQNQILGRTKSGTAAVGLDERGMWYEVEVPETEIGRHVLSAIERGDVDQSSWGFMLRYDDTTNGDRWEKKNGKEHRILTDVKMVFDASPVTFPANPETSAAKRSFEMFTTPDEGEKIKQARSAEIAVLQTEYLF
jgi:HK97 family phage prohead protease